MQDKSGLIGAIVIVASAIMAWFLLPYFILLIF